MAQFIPPNYNLIRYELGIIDDQHDGIKLPTVTPYSLYHSLHQKYKVNHHLIELWDWYAILSITQLKNIKLWFYPDLQNQGKKFRDYYLQLYYINHQGYNDNITLIHKLYDHEGRRYMYLLNSMTEG